MPSHNHHENHKHHDHGNHHEMMMNDFKSRFVFSLLLTLPILALSPMISDALGILWLTNFTGSRFVLFAFSTALFFYGGKPFLTHAKAELKDKNPGMMMLITLAISVAYLYSSAVVFGLPGKLFFWELATLVDIMLLGHWLEMRSVIGASQALNELSKLLPSTAHKLAGRNKVTEVAIEDLRIGDRILVKPGEKVPADGQVVEGSSNVNEAIITGESQALTKQEGDEVIGGSLNQRGSITVKITRLGKESFLSQIVGLVEEAQNSKSRTQDLANRAAKWLFYIGLGAGIVTFAGWLLLSNRDMAYAIERAVTVMIITCPHALGLAIPLVVAVSTAKSAKNGLLVRDRRAFENARNIDTVVFDKTGTLTHGRFGVTSVTALDKKYDKESILRLAASLESRSDHPVANAIATEIEHHDSVSNFNSLTGEGVEGTVGKRDIKVVSPGYLERNNIKHKSTNSNSDTVVYVLIDRKLAGEIQLADKVREESKQAVRELTNMGIETYMLTGDNQLVADKVSKQIGLTNYFAEVLPSEKSDKIKQLQAQGKRVAMVGDGVNDAPALAQADIGIAIGTGTDVAAETADIILVKDNPRDVVQLVSFAQATYRKMIQNLLWAAGYNVFAIPLAAGALLWAGLIVSPAFGAVLMSASTVIVAINARLLKMPS